MHLLSHSVAHPMTTVPFLPFRALLLTATLALAACVSVPPPVSELAAAQQAIARALDADAKQHAGEDISRAQDLFAQAQTMQADGQNDQARQLAWRAAAVADLAAARSRNAIALATLGQRRSEVEELRRRLQQEPLP